MNMAAKKPYIKKKKTKEFFTMTQVAKDAFTLSLNYMREEYDIAIFEKKIDQQVPGWKTCRYLVNSKQGYTGHIYTGYNKAMLYPYKDDIFITLECIKKLGASLKPDAQPAFIHSQFPYTKTKNIHETEEDFKKRFMYTKWGHTSKIVYGISQVEGLPEKKSKTSVVSIKKESVEEFISRFALLQNITIETIGSSVSFDLLKNTITIPALSQFTDTNSYYFELFKQFILLSGVKLGVFDNEDQAHSTYDIPALISEIGSAALCHMLDCSLPPDTSDYVYTWLDIMKQDTSILPWATKKAEEIFNSLLPVSK